MKDCNEDNKSASDSMDKFMRFCNAVVTVIMVVVTGYLFLLSVFNTSMINFYMVLEDRSLSEVTMYLTDSPLVHIAAIVLTFLLGYLIANHFQMPSNKAIKRILITIHILVFIVMLISVFLYAYEPIYDQYNILISSYNLINGYYDGWEIGGYNYAYPALNSTILLFSPMVYLFGIDGGITAIRIFNLGMLLVGSYSFYGFCIEAKLKSFVTSLIFIMYFPISLYVFFIYGNIASLSLSIFAIWRAVRYLNHKHKKDVLLSAMAAVISLLFKDTALIALVAILLVIGICSIVSGRWKQLIWLPVFIAICIGGNWAVNGVISTITEEEVPNDADFYGHLYMGISEGNRANGWYNDVDIQLRAAYNFDYTQYKPTVKTLFQQRLEELLSDPSYTFNFFSKKTSSQWNNPTFQSIWNIQYMQFVNVVDKDVECTPSLLWIDGTVPNMIFYFIYNIMQSLIIFGSLCYFVFEARKASLPSLIPAITFIGGFIFLFFWEAKAQYTLLFFIMLFPYVAPGFSSLYKGLTSLRNAGQKSKWYRSGKIIFLGVILLLVLLISIIDTPFLNNTVKLGIDDEYYDECLEQSVYFFGQLYGID